MSTPVTPAATSATTPLTPDTAASSRVGHWVWHDLMTTDVAGAQAFYGALFGWTTCAVPMGDFTYEMIAGPGGDVGGMMPLMGGPGDPPPHWMSYLGVADVDATCAGMPAAGGQVCVPPTDIPNVGRFAVIADSEGAYLSPFRGPGDPPPARVPAGHFCWHELMAGEVARARTFYERLVGWRSDAVDMGDTGTYWIFRRGDVPAAGMMAQASVGDGSGGPSSWLPYVAVASADDAAARIVALGGTLLVGPCDVQDWGRFAVARDPQGAAFAVLEDRTPAPDPGVGMG